jgi:hypothetical protein
VIDDIADRIDARFDRELRAKQDEVDALKSDNAELQARLDAGQESGSMALVEHADGSVSDVDACKVTFTDVMGEDAR